MKAQTLYGLRDQTGFCSGDDLHAFFKWVCGVPSPSGDVVIHDMYLVRKFIRQRLDHMALHNGGNLDGLFSADELCRLMEV